jgi:hypothetical protein
MVYNWCTFLDCYNVSFALQAYFLPTHRNGEVPVLGKLPYTPCTSIPNPHHFIIYYLCLHKSWPKVSMEKMGREI